VYSARGTRVLYSPVLSSRPLTRTAPEERQEEETVTFVPPAIPSGKSPLQTHERCERQRVTYLDLASGMPPSACAGAPSAGRRRTIRSHHRCDGRQWSGTRCLVAGLVPRRRAAIGRSSATNWCRYPYASEMFLHCCL
jgi:hypothetical protein